MQKGTVRLISSRELDKRAYSSTGNVKSIYRMDIVQAKIQYGAHKN